MDTRSPNEIAADLDAVRGRIEHAETLVSLGERERVTARTLGQLRDHLDRLLIQEAALLMEWDDACRELTGF